MVAAICAAASAASAAPLFRALEIGAPPRSDGLSPTGFNDLGHVTGTVENDFGENLYSFFWSPESGLKKIVPTNGAAEVFSRGINNFDTIVGESYVGPLGIRELQPFFWDPVAGFRAERLFGEKSYSILDVRQIQDNGEILGNYLDFHHKYLPTPFISTENSKAHPLTDVRNFGVMLDASMMNNAGQVVGYRLRNGCDSLPVLYDRNSGVTKILGTIGHPKPGRCQHNGDALGINNLGEVVGSSDSNLRYGSQAFLWTESSGMEALKGPVQKKAIDLTATSINDATQVVGWYTPRSLLETGIPFYWDRESHAHDLNDLLDRSDPRDEAIMLISIYPRINNRGQILVQGYRRDESRFTRLYVLTPVVP